MTTPIKLLDVVALTVDLPEYNLWRGQVGTVVERSSRVALRLKLNFVIGKDARTSQSAYVQIRLWCYTMSH